VGRGVKLWTWLETVLRNHFRDLLRRGEELPPLPPGPPPGPPAPPPIVDDVQSTVDTLLPDDPQRERKILAFKLYYKEGYTYQEIAEKLGIAVGTAHNWVKEVKEAFCEEFPKQRPEYF
jgi:DNA-directed RNA polymerase specialized sigma24 family protein